MALIFDILILMRYLREFNVTSTRYLRILSQQDLCARIAEQKGSIKRLNVQCELFVVHILICYVVPTHFSSSSA